MTRYIRNGLLYRSINGLTRYRPDRPFTVDGIHYDRPGTVARPIFELIEFDYGATARMNHHQPPTDTELDLWVKEDPNGDYLHHR